ncbi:HNH endonuclease [Cellulosimicrobium terreum]|nr:HNH endonuclease [Cellulosimicrobium terreum]
MHYARQRRGVDLGSAGYVRRPGRTVEERVFDRLVEDTAAGCWVWQGATRNGYGVLGLDERVVYVHRWVYEHMIAAVPDGLVIDHLCVNRLCANPEHLEPVTRAVNNARGGETTGTRKAVAA